MNKDTSNLTRYVESFSADNRFLRRVDSEELHEKLSKVSSKLKESIGSDSNTKGWWVPISFYNKRNGNGRIYNKKLWENVINNQRDIYVGAPMLADHPAGDSDGSPKDICGIWLDAKLDSPDADGVGLVYGLLIPSGSLGDDLKSHLMNGMKIGTSSSGFGKLMSDGETVDPDSYVIERLSDFVLNPSQGTFFSYDEADDDIVDHSNYSEKIENKTNYIENIYNKGNIKEKSMKDSKITKLEEKKFRRDMESFLESAENICDPQERLEEFREIKSYLEDGACPDLREKIEQKIAEEEAYIKTALKEKRELKEELNIDSPKELKEKLTKIVQDAKYLDKEAKDWKAISEKLQSKYSEAKKELDSRHTNTFVEYQTRKISKLEKTLEEALKSSDLKIKSLIEELECAKGECEEKDSKIQDLESENAELEESKKNLEKSIAQTTERLRVVNEALKESENNLSASNKKLSSTLKIVEAQRAKIEGNIEDNFNLKTINENKTKRVNSLAKSLKKSELALKNKYEEDMEAQKVEDMRDTDAYYESLYNKYGNEIRPYENKIRNAYSLAEAKKIFFKDALQNMNSSKKITESLLPRTSAISTEQRLQKLGESKFSTKSTAIDIARAREGWY